MTTRTRYFLIGGVLVLVLGLAVGLVAYYVAPGGVLSRASGPVELQYLPANATAVAYADVHDVMSSSFRQRVLRAEPDEHGRREFEARTGINVERDIDHVVACLAPADGAAETSGLVLVSGRFDEPKISSLVKEHEAHAESYGGKSILVHDEDGQQFALSFLDRDLIALGTEALVKSAIDLQAGRGTSVLTNGELMGLIRSENQSDTAWAVGRYEALAAHAQLPVEVTSRIPPITLFSVAGHVNDTVSGTVKAETRDDQSAQNLRQVVQGLIALARMQVGSQPDLQNLLQSVQLSGSGRTVAVSFSVPSTLLDRLPGGAEHRRRDRQPHPQR
jgi:hypothetical protein